MFDANPYWRENASRFFYQRLDVLFNAPFKRLYDTDCFLGQRVDDRKCSFPTPTTLEHEVAPGRSEIFSDFGQGCGDVHHKPNIYGTGVVAAQACENYALCNGTANQDVTTLFSVPGSLADEKIAEYDARFGRDCDGGWQAYMRQSISGLGNPAIAEDGTPMKNWWPFLFY
jgi:hypothetical protein